MAEPQHLVLVHLVLSLLAALLVVSGLAGWIAARTPRVTLGWARCQGRWRLWALFSFGLLLVALAVGVALRL